MITYKFSDLSPTARDFAIMDYLQGWKETHPDGDEDYDWAQDMCENRFPFAIYNSKGAEINDQPEVGSMLWPLVPEGNVYRITAVGETAMLVWPVYKVLVGGRVIPVRKEFKSETILSETELHRFEVHDLEWVINKVLPELD